MVSPLIPALLFKTYTTFTYFLPVWTHNRTHFIFQSCLVLRLNWRLWPPSSTWTVKSSSSTSKLRTLRFLFCGFFVCSYLLLLHLNMSYSCGFRYLFGEEVHGTAYVVFGIIQEGQKKSFPSSLQRVPVSTFCQFAIWLVILAYTVCV